MARFEFRLPDIGEGIAEAEIVAWHVKPGDTVREDQPVADLMTDKATVEMESPVSGFVREIAGDVGDMVAIGAPLMVIETAAEAVDDAAPTPSPAPAAQEAMPDPPPHRAMCRSRIQKRPKLPCPPPLHRRSPPLLCARGRKIWALI